MIRCQALEEKSLFVSAKGEIIPCCHIYDGGHELSYNLKEIVKDKNFESLVESWNDPTPNRLSYKCHLICNDANSNNPRSMQNFQNQWKNIHVLKKTDK